jgi:hypothetical protein
MQIFGTRFQITLGDLQLRIGLSLENQSDAGVDGANS